MKAWIIAALLLPVVALARGGPAGPEVLQWIEQGQYSRAEAALRRSLAIAQQPAAEYLLGLCLLRQFRFSEAEAHLRSATQAVPGRHRWLHALAESLLEQGRCKSALEALDRALALAELPQYHHDKAMCLLNVGDQPAARLELEAALEGAPGNVMALYQLGKLLGDAGEPAEAVRRLRKAVTLSPGHVEARYELARLIGAAGEAEESVAILQSILDAVPGHVGARYNLGQTLLRLGRAEEGRAALREFQSWSGLEEQIQNRAQVVQTRPGDAALRLELAELLLSAGRATEATVQAKAAVALSPGLARAQRVLARAYGRQGLTELARQAEGFAAEIERAAP